MFSCILDPKGIFTSQLAFTCLKLTTETLEKGVKYLVPVFLLLTLSK